jgi:hypothetical protein
MPSWAKLAMDVWCKAADIVTGPVFLAIRKGGHIQKAAMTPQAIRDVVAEYASKVGGRHCGTT